MTRKEGNGNVPPTATSGAQGPTPTERRIPQETQSGRGHLGEVSSLMLWDVTVVSPTTGSCPISDSESIYIVDPVCNS